MICITWDGLAQYSARCIGAFVKSTTERVVLIATRPTVPIKGMEEAVGCPVNWIGQGEIVDLLSICKEMPRVLFSDGWFNPSFNHFRDQARAGGAKVICMADNNFIPTFREFLRECVKAIRFRLKIRSKYDGFLVPGKSGVRLLKFYGVPESRIATGMYAADASVFFNGKPLVERPKRILFVGRFIPLKNISRMLEAFNRANADGGWSLDLYGSGPLKDEINRIIEQSKKRTVHLHDFVQPEQLSALYRDARVFCLPSWWDHWGLVVHESALSGCVLLVSKQVGAGEDFLGNANGFRFDAFDVDEMTQKFVAMMRFDDEQWARAQEESLNLASRVGVDSFGSGLRKFL